MVLYFFLATIKSVMDSLIPLVKKKKKKKYGGQRLKKFLPPKEKRVRIPVGLATVLSKSVDSLSQHLERHQEKSSLSNLNIRLCFPTILHTVTVH